jgi:hypothetical protein
MLIAKTEALAQRSPRPSSMSAMTGSPTLQFLLMAREGRLCADAAEAANNLAPPAGCLHSPPQLMCALLTMLLPLAPAFAAGTGSLLRRR